MRNDESSSSIPDRVGPYRLVRALGGGTFSRVVLAEAPADGARVVLKLARHGDASTRHAFREEYRQASRLCHPHLGEVIDHGLLGDRPYLVLAAHEGVPLAEIEAPAPAETVAAVGWQLARALTHMHEAGLLHRDVAPANVLLTGAGHARLIDFGLIAPPGAGPAAGTPLTMAPEAIAGEATDARADLYSLGALLYRLACGRAPFEGLPAEAMLDAVLRLAPPSLAEAAPHLPPALAAGIMRLVATDPADRPADAREVAAAMARFCRATAAVPGHGRWLHTDAMSAWEAMGNRPGVAAFVGEAGVGVSRHLQEAFRRLRRQDHAALRLGAREGDAPYALLARLWRWAAAEGPPASLSPARRRAIAGLWPWAFPDERQGPAHGLREAIAAGLAELLGRAGPVAVLIDRFEAADPASRGVLEAGWRGELAGFHWLLGSHAPVAGARAIAIAPFSREASAAWLSDCLGQPVAPALADRLHESFGGTPGFMAQALHGATPEALPSSIASLMAAQWERLGPAERALAEAMAVWGEPFDPDAPGPMADALGPGRRPALDGLAAAGLVAGEGGACRFRPGAWGPFVRDRMAPARRRALAAGFLAAIAPAEGPACQDAPRLHRLATLAAMAEDPALAVAYGLAAGRASARLHANEQALAHLASARRALAEAPDPAAYREQAVAIAVAEADVRRVTGDLAAAAAAYESLLAEAPPAARGRLLVSLGKARQMLNQPAAAASALTEALSLLPATDAEERLRALCALGRVLHHQGRRAESLARYEEALAIADGPPAHRAEALAFLGAAYAGMPGRDEEGLGMLRESLALREALGDPLALNDAHMLLGNALYGLGRFGEAIAHFEANQALAAAAGSRQEEAFARLNLSLCEAERGRYREAIVHLEAGRALAGAIGDELLIGLAGFLEGLCRLHLGELGAAEPALAAARDREASLASPYLRVYGLMAEAERHVYLGGFEAARRACELGLGLVAKGAGQECAPKLRLMLAEAWLHQGQLEAAGQALAAAEGPAADRLRGLEAMRRGEPDSARALWRRGLEAARRQGLVGLEIRLWLALSALPDEPDALEEAYALAESARLPDLLAVCLLERARRHAEAGAELVADRLQRRGEALIEHLTAQLPSGAAREAFLAHPERAPFLAVPAPSEARRLKRQARRLEMLLELGAALGRVREPERVLAMVSAFTREVTQAERCVILLGAQAEALTPCGEETVYSRTIVGRVCASREPLCVLDTQEEEALDVSTSLMAMRVRAVMCVPMVVEEALVGVIYVDSQVALGAFTDDDLRVLVAIANQAAVALDGARLHTALSAQLVRQEAYIRRLEESEQVIRHLEELDRVRAQYFQAASHDLRGPLNSINASCQALLKGLFGPMSLEQVETVEGVHHSSRSLVALIDGILDAARLETGKLYLNPQPVAIVRPLTEAVRLLSALAADKGLAIRFDPVAVGALPPVAGDERRLLQVAINLLGNAIKFTPAGHVAVTAAADHEALTVEVADTGPGMPPERAHDPFERYGAVSAAAPGSGLGLWLVKGLVDLHGGAIAVESRPGEGCAFRIRLPLA